MACWCLLVLNAGARSGMVREVGLLFGVGAVDAKEVMLESCASVGDAT